MSEVHELKCWPEPFQAMREGRKTLEFRKDDRHYQVGDVLRLREWSPTEGPSGEADDYEVTHILHGPDWGIPVGYCAMSVRAIRKPNTELATDGPTALDLPPLGVNPSEQPA